jgi:hypothetical protein
MEGEHNKSWNDHGVSTVLQISKSLSDHLKKYISMDHKTGLRLSIGLHTSVSQVIEFLL